MKNSGIQGFLIYGFQRIRDVQLIELRNGFKKDFDKSVLFFIERMGNSVYSNHIDLKKWEETKQLAFSYAIYTIHYSIKPLKDIYEERGVYDYILISSSEDIVKDYYLGRREFYQKTDSDYFCKIADIEELIQIPREYFFAGEIGELLAA